MGRKLYKSQEKLLTKWAENNPNLYHWEDLTYEQQKELESKNDYEVIHHDTSRFLSDYQVNKKYGGRT